MPLGVPKNLSYATQKRRYFFFFLKCLYVSAKDYAVISLDVAVAVELKTVDYSSASFPFLGT
jgi:hypothetical protein